MAKLDGSIKISLPEALIAHTTHIALRGRQKPKELNLFDRIKLIIDSLNNPDPVTSQEELKGFDFMDKSGIEPNISLIEKLQSDERIIRIA